MTKPSVDTWNPGQYVKFSQERDQPFYDLMHLVKPKPDMHVVDLGCGTGVLTKVLHQTLKAKETLGIDASAAMLQGGQGLVVPGLAFEQITIETYTPKRPLDLIFSNAALQWLPGHRDLIAKLATYLAPHGQLAIQMPANFDAPTHVIARELALEEPYRAYLGEGLTRHVLSAEEYAQLLYDLGFKQQHVRLQVYPPVMESSEAIVEWVKGSLLTYYQRYLPSDLFATFLSTYSERLHHHYGDQRPLFFPFKRLLLWAGIAVFGILTS